MAALSLPKSTVASRVTRTEVRSWSTRTARSRSAVETTMSTTGASMTSTGAVCPDASGVGLSTVGRVSEEPASATAAATTTMMAMWEV